MPGPRRQPLHRRPAATAGARGAGQSGQSSLEYVGVLMVVALGLVLAGAVTGAGGIANAVGRGVERALCVVGGGDCFATEVQACALSSSETSGRVGVKLTFVELGGRLSLLRQELSDGTVDITLVDGADLAPTAAIGAKGGVRTGTAAVGGGAISSAELLVRLGRRRVWHVADDAAADRLVRDVRRDVAVRLATHAVPGIGMPVRALAHLVGVDPPRLPPPDEVGFSGGVQGLMEAEVPGASVSATAEASLGGSRDRASGRTSVVLALEGQASGALATAVGGAGLSGSAGASATVTFDRTGAPLDLAVSVAGTPRPGLAGGLDVPSKRTSGGAAERVERTTHLDLTRSDNRAAYDAVVRALAHPPGSDLGGSIVALARRLAAGGRQDIARYSAHSGTYGLAGEAALGARVGGEVELTRTALALQDAWTRPAGGVWEQRADCLDHASRA